MSDGNFRIIRSSCTSVELAEDRCHDATIEMASELCSHVCYIERVDDDYIRLYISNHLRLLRQLSCIVIYLKCTVTTRMYNGPNLNHSNPLVAKDRIIVMTR